jgi:hypothetical protein
MSGMKKSRTGVSPSTAGQLEPTEVFNQPGLPTNPHPKNFSARWSREILRIRKQVEWVAKHMNEEGYQVEHMHAAADKLTMALIRYERLTDGN